MASMLASPSLSEALHSAGVRSYQLETVEAARRSVICAVDFDGLELRRVVRQEVARLHARRLEGSFPAGIGE